MTDLAWMDQANCADVEPNTMFPGTDRADHELIIVARRPAGEQA